MQTSDREHFDILEQVDPGGARRSPSVPPSPQPPQHLPPVRLLCQRRTPSMSMSGEGFQHPRRCLTDVTVESWNFQPSTNHIRPPPFLNDRHPAREGLRTPLLLISRETPTVVHASPPPTRRPSLPSVRLVATSHAEAGSSTHYILISSIIQNHVIFISCHPHARVVATKLL